MDFWSFLFIGLTLIGSLLIVYAGHVKSQHSSEGPQKPSDDKRKKFTFLHWSFLSLMLAVIGTVLNIFAGELKSQHSQTKLKKDLFAVKKELNEKSQKIEELSNFILSNITGGDSFCYFAISGFSRDNSVGLLLLTHSGQYPLHQVEARIADLDKLERVTPDSTIDDFLKEQEILQIGTLAPNFSKLFSKKVLLRGRTKLRWNIFITAQNGSLTQKLRMNLIKGRWQTATRVINGKMGNILYEKIDTDFPKDEAGAVKWD